MKKILILIVIIFSFNACKKNTPSDGGNQNLATLNENLVGRWNLVQVKYSGLATLPPPLDTTIRLPFQGEGQNVIGYYLFDSIPNPDSMYFEMLFTAPIDFTGGASTQLTIDEEGFGDYTVNLSENRIQGTHYTIPPSGDTTMTYSEWRVDVNEQNRQVWTIDRTYYWDQNTNIPIDIEMTMTLVR